MSNDMAWGLVRRTCTFRSSSSGKRGKRLSRYGLWQLHLPPAEGAGNRVDPPGRPQIMTEVRREDMQLEFRHGGPVMRVDGDVAEIFGAVGFSHRYLLPSLRVEVQPSSKGTLVVRSASAPADWPLYELYAKARYQQAS
jgi:hypothetical protein